MPSYRDLTGNKFGRWTVLRHSHVKYAEQFWVCQCDCGTERIIVGSSLKTGRSTSCGCFGKKLHITHGMYDTPTYNTWGHMLTRCRNTKHKQYPDYGGRGIKVCKEWEQFENFFADMGEKPNGLSLDRIDNDGDYNKLNCRWSDIKTQIRNRRVSPKYEFNGEFKSLAELAENHNISWRRVYERIRKGWNVYDALTTPIRSRRCTLT